MLKAANYSAPLVKISEFMDNSQGQK